MLWCFCTKNKRDRTVWPWSVFAACSGRTMADHCSQQMCRIHSVITGDKQKTIIAELERVETATRQKPPKTTKNPNQTWELSYYHGSYFREQKCLGGAGGAIPWGSDELHAWRTLRACSSLSAETFFNVCHSQTVTFSLFRSSQYKMCLD